MGKTRLLIFSLNVKEKVFEQLPNARRCSHSCHFGFHCGWFQKHPPDSLLSCRFLYILMSSSKKTKEPELSEAVPPKCSVFFLKDTSASAVLLSCLHGEVRRLVTRPGYPDSHLLQNIQQQLRT